MTPTSALVAILLITLASTAMAAPLTWEIRAELKRAQLNLGNYASIGILTGVLGFVLLGLWWYYALETDQILLAIIPTVAYIWSLVTRLIVKAAKS